MLDLLVVYKEKLEYYKEIEPRDKENMDKRSSNSE